MIGNPHFFFVLVITGILSGTNVYSQNSVVVSGGSATGAGGMSTYTVGQIVYTTLSGDNESVLQGIQQPYEIVTLGKDEFSEINLTITAFPNPTADVFNLVLTNDKFDNLSFSLFDINGKVLTQNLRITSSETKVSMQGLNNGVYFLKVTNNSKTLKTFKIIKK